MRHRKSNNLKAIAADAKSLCYASAQYSSREEYLDILSVRNNDLHFDPVLWGYGPEWWHKPALINARSETAFSGRMFRPLIQHGRAVVPADG